MFTHKDIEIRTIFVLNCIEQTRNLRVCNGELMLEEITDGKKAVLTKFPFQKILALFIIGHITITTPLIEKCKKFNVALVVMKPNLRPVFYWSNTAEANYLLRQRQYSLKKEDISIPKIIVANKIQNQLATLRKTRKKDELTTSVMTKCEAALNTIDDISDYDSLLGLEGSIAKCYFAAYFQQHEWKGRLPRVKSDILNVILDIGYTILFNYVECFVRMFGFDLYVGVYHRLWFKRKSLICDLMEPFRCIIDHIVLLALNKKQFKTADFVLRKNEYYLKPEQSSYYYKTFYEELIKKKQTCLNMCKDFTVVSWAANQSQVTLCFCSDVSCEL